MAPQAIQNDPRVQDLEAQVSQLTEQLQGISKEREDVKGVADRFQGMEERMKSLLQLSEILSIRYNPFLDEEEPGLFDDRDPRQLLPETRPGSEVVPMDETASPTPRQAESTLPAPQRHPGAEVVPEDPMAVDEQADRSDPGHGGAAVDAPEETDPPVESAGPEAPHPTDPMVTKPADSLQDRPADLEAPEPDHREHGGPVGWDDEATCVQVAEEVLGRPEQGAVAQALHPSSSEQDPSSRNEAPDIRGHDGDVLPVDGVHAENPARAATQSIAGTGRADRDEQDMQHQGAPATDPRHDRWHAPVTQAPRDGPWHAFTASATHDGGGQEPAEVGHRPHWPDSDTGRQPQDTHRSDAAMAPEHAVPPARPDARRAYMVLSWFERLASVGDPSEVHLFVQHYVRLGWIPARYASWMHALADGIAPQRDDLQWSDLHLTGPELVRLHRDNLCFLQRMFHHVMPEEDPAMWARQSESFLGGG